MLLGGRGCISRGGVSEGGRRKWLTGKGSSRVAVLPAVAFVRVSTSGVGEKTTAVCVQAR